MSVEACLKPRQEYGSKLIRAVMNVMTKETWVTGFWSLKPGGNNDQEDFIYYLTKGVNGEETTLAEIIIKPYEGSIKVTCEKEYKNLGRQIEKEYKKIR